MSSSNEDTSGETIRSMKKCREVGCYECDFIVTGETEEEIMSNAAVHGIKEHSRTHKDMVEMRERLKGFIHTLTK